LIGSDFFYGSAAIMRARIHTHTHTHTHTKWNTLYFYTMILARIRHCFSREMLGQSFLTSRHKELSSFWSVTLDSKIRTISTSISRRKKGTRAFMKRLMQFHSDSNNGRMKWRINPRRPNTVLTSPEDLPLYVI